MSRLLGHSSFSRRVLVGWEVSVMAPVVSVVGLPVVLGSGKVEVLGAGAAAEVVGPVVLGSGKVEVLGAGAAAEMVGPVVLGPGPARRLASSPPYLVPPPSPQRHLG
jgi:hypothetical protein